MATQLYRYDYPQDPEYTSEFYPVLDAQTVRRNLRKGDTVELTDEQAAYLGSRIHLTVVTDPASPPPVVSGPVIGMQDLGLDWLEVGGHSLAAGGGSRVSPIGGYAHRLKGALGIKNWHDYAIGGAIACRPNAVATGDGGYPWILRNLLRPGMPALSTLAAGSPYGPQSQIVLEHHGLNDLGILGAAKPLPFQTALRTILARFCASSVFFYTNAAFTYTGTWQTLGIADVNASSTDPLGIKFTQTVGDKVVFTVPADFPGSNVVNFTLWVNSTYAQLTIGVKIDGVDQPDLVLTPANMTDQTIANQHIIHTLRIGTGISGDPYSAALAPGAHTITLTLKGGPALAVDAAAIETDPLDGPLLLCPLPNKPATYGIWASWAGGPSMNDAVVDQWKDYERAILAEFPGRVITDPTDGKLGIDLDYMVHNRYTQSPGSNPPPAGIVPDFISDGAHPVDSLHGRWAEYCASAVRESSLLTDRIRTRPFVDPRPRAWKKVGAVSGAGTFGPGWSNLGSAGLPDLQWRTDENRRVFVRGDLKAAAGVTATVLTANSLPKPQNNVGKGGGAQFDPATSSWYPRQTRVSNAGTFTSTGNTAIPTAAGNISEFDFDYLADI